MSIEKNPYLTVEELDATIDKDERRLAEIQYQATLETGSAAQGAEVARKFADLFGTNITKLQRAAAACNGGRISREDANNIYLAEMRKKGLVPLSDVVGKSR